MSDRVLNKTVLLPMVSDALFETFSYDAFNSALGDKLKSVRGEDPETKKAKTLLQKRMTLFEKAQNRLSKTKGATNIDKSETG